MQAKIPPKRENRFLGAFILGAIIASSAAVAIQAGGISEMASNVAELRNTG